MLNQLRKFKKLITPVVPTKTQEELQAEALESQKREAMLRTEELENESL